MEYREKINVKVENTIQNRKKNDNILCFNSELYNDKIKKSRNLKKG